MPRKGDVQIRQLSIGKTCVGCTEWKLLEEFAVRNAMVDGRRSRCRACDRLRGEQFRERDPEGFREYQRLYHERRKGPERSQKMRIHNLRRLYGISVEDYDALVEAQSGLCAICQNPPTNSPSDKLCVDHDHDTGVVRGLLCNTCNAGIAMLKESEEVMHAAIAYLSRHT